MIYAYNKSRSNTACINEGFAVAQQRAIAADELYRKLDGGEIEAHKLVIPRNYARLETGKRSRLNEVEDLPHYEIYLPTQVGGFNNRKETLVYFRLPNVNNLFSVILHKDGSVRFAKHEHKFILRVSDELDRRIILGFCKMYGGNISSICYGNGGYYANRELNWLKDEAVSYNASKQPKRVKSGCYGAYGECGIFTNISLI